MSRQLGMSDEVRYAYLTIIRTSLENALSMQSSGRK